MLVFLIGLVAGVLGTLFLPRILGPYLPQSLRGADQEMVGVVTAKERQADQLLLTVDSESGAVLATFSRRVAEIALLVDPGDSVTLALREADPFVHDPRIVRVAKVTPSDRGVADAVRDTPAEVPAAADSSPSAAAVSRDSDTTAVPDSAGTPGS